MNSKRLYTLVVAALLATLSILPTVARAQAISGDIVGTVTDKSGGAIPNATVTAENVATGVKATTTANDHGDYHFGNLPIGTYNVRASSTNFADATVSNVVVELNKTISTPIMMQVGQQVTTIEVTGAPPPINTTSSQIENTFNARQTADLPSASVGLGVLNLSLLQAGVASSGGVGAGTGPSVGGQRPRNNNFTIEGVDNNNKGVTGPLVQVPNDAVEEFSMLSNQYSPEFGHSTGGQFNQVVKSGTNKFHGKAYEYFNNRNLNAIDEQTIQSGLTSNPRYDFNRMGGQVGGPILKNKLFFFGNYEYDPLGQASTVAGGTCTPTAAGYATLAAITGPAGLSATNLAQLAKYGTPAPTGGNCGNVNATDPAGKPNTTNSIFITNPMAAAGFTPVEVGTLPIAAPNFINFKFLTTSMDYDFTSKDQLRGRYIYNSAVGIDIAANLPAFFTPSPTKYHLVTLAEYHTFISNVQNELRLGYNRFDNITSSGNFAYPGLDSYPDLIFFDLNLQLGPDPNGPQFTIQNLYQAVDNVSWVRGNHTFKFGLEGRKYISPQSFTQRSRGDYNYNTTDLFLHDQNPDNLSERSLGNPVYYGDQIAIYSYINDNWKIRPNLTINLGLRHEYTTIPTGERLQQLNSAASVPGLIDFSEPRAPKANFAPRVGFAWSPGSSQTTSIRGGFGLGYDVLYDNIGILSLPPQLSGTIDNPQPPVITNFLGMGGILPVAGGLQTFTPATADCAANGIADGLPCQRFSTSNHIVVDQKSPAAVQWTLGVQHTFGSKYTLEVRYLGTHGYHLNTQSRINVQPRTDATHFIPTFLTAPSQATVDALGAQNTVRSIRRQPRIVPAFAANDFTTNIVQFTPNGNSIYHGLAVEFKRRFSNGLTFNTAYTWSHLIDDSTADFFTTVLTPRRPQDFQNLHADRSTSALDRRHRLTVSAIYDLPFFKNGNWFARNLIGNWSILPAYTFQSPEFADVQSGRDANLNGDSAGDRAFVNGAGVRGTGSGVTPMCTSALPVFATCGEHDFMGGVPGPGNFDTDPFIAAYVAINPNAQYIRAERGALAFPSAPISVANGVLPIAGRNTLATRRTNNFDLAVAKKFNITEGIRFEFQAQAQNVLNHPQSIPGFLNRVDSIGFTGSAQRNALVPGNSSFGKFQDVYSSNSRILQLVFKFVF